MELQTARNGALPIQAVRSDSRFGTVTNHDVQQSVPDGTGTAVIQSLKQYEFAEINGKRMTIGEEQLMRAIERALKEMIGPDTALEVKIHEQTHSVVMRVLNRETGELIREVPPERTLDIIFKMMEIAGLLFDERV